jgi:hypothetical protein
MALGTHIDKYTLGRGELYFAPFISGTENPQGFRYLGNTPEFNLTINEEKLDHYSSDRGIREKDRSISLQVDRTGTLITDNISVENVAMFFFGETSTVTATSATVSNEVVKAAQKGLYYQLGVSTANPAGVRALDVHTVPTTKIVLTDVAGLITYTEGTDYIIDMDLAMLYITPNSTIVAGADLHVDYKTKASTRSRVISGSTAIKGALKFVATNPEGEKIDYYFPYVSLSPNGDYALKGDEWQQIPLNVEIIKPASGPAIVAESRAVVA